MKRAAVLLAVLAACGSRRVASRDDDGAGDPTAHEDDAEPAPPPPPDARRGLTVAQLDALATIEVPAWTIDARDRTETTLVVTLRQDALRAVVTAGRCLRCREMEPAAWQDEVPALRAIMPGAIEDDPATKFELAATDIAGRACITTWELGAMTYGDEIMATHGARIYCQDGDVELVVRVDDDAVTRARSASSARKGAVRATVEDAARTLAEAFSAGL